MWTEKQFDNYNEAMRDLRERNRNSGEAKALENIATSFNLGIQRAPKVLKDKLKKTGRDEWFSLAALLWDGICFVLKVQAAAIAIGAVIGGIVGSLVPLGGTAAGAVVGARIGTTIAGWFLGLAGLLSTGALAGHIGGAVSVDFDQGKSAAKNGQLDAAANHFANGIARVVEMTAAIVILFCFARGGQRVLSKIKSQFPAKSKLLAALKDLPAPVSNFQRFFQSSGWGYSSAEITALLQMSRGGRFFVIRTCNPGRVAVGKGVALPPKGLEIKGKSFKGGINDGKVGVDAEDVAKLKQYYDFQPIKDVGYKLKLKPGKDGNLDNHTLEFADYYKAGEHRGQMLLLDAQKRYYIPDMDRLVCMELETTTMKAVKLKDLARFTDDPAEIQKWNSDINRLLPAGKRVNTEVAAHGYTSVSAQKTGKPIWHPKDGENEKLLVFADGRLFEMSYNHFVLFAEANQTLNMPQCFKLITP